MSRIVPIALAAVLALGVGAANAQGKKAAAKAQSTTGVVKTVSASSLALENGKTFSVDGSTKLLAAGSTAKTAEKKAAGAPGLQITDMIHAGDRVTVRYTTNGTAMMATEVRKASK